MKNVTYVTFKRGDKIPKEDTLKKCNKCGSKINSMKGYLKLGSIFVENEISIKLVWTVFCDECSPKIAKYLKADGRS